jgi:acyl-CoA reductase-like NAD-dependent aldehyde dehydrogenase
LEGDGYATLEEMNEAQLERAVDVALRVRRMTSDERAEWLSSTWDRLQDSANALYAPFRATRPQESMAICFLSFFEKNAYDEQRRLDFAVAWAKYLRQQP